MTMPTDNPFTEVIDDLAHWGVQDKTSVQKVLKTKYNAMIRYQWIQSFKAGSIEIVCLGKKACKAIRRQYRNPNPNQLRRAYQRRIILEQMIEQGWKIKQTKHNHYVLNKPHQQVNLIISHNSTKNAIRMLPLHLETELILFHQEPSKIQPRKNLTILPMPETRKP